MLSLSCDISCDIQEGVPVCSEGDIKWKMYQCYIELKEYQQALDIVRTLCNHGNRVTAVFCVHSCCQYLWYKDLWEY